MEAVRSKKLSDIALMLNTTLELDSILRHATRATTELTDVEAAFILLPDEAQEQLQLQAHYATFVEKNELNPRLSLSLVDSTAGEAFKSRQSSAHQNPSDLDELIPGHPIAFVAYVPLISRRRVVGVLAAYNSSKDDALSDTAKNILDQLGMHIAVAIDNARIYADSQQRGFELALVIDATEAVNSTLSMPRVLSLVGKNLLKALNVNWCEIITCDFLAEQLTTLSTQREATWDGGEGRRLSMREMHHVEQSFSQKRAVVLDDENISANVGELMLLGGARSVLLVPFFLYKGRTLFGMLKVAFEDLSHAEKMQVEMASALERKGYEMAVSISKNDASRALHMAHQVMRDAEASDCALWIWDAEAHAFEQRLHVSNTAWTQAPFPQRNLTRFPTLEKAANRFSVVNFGDADAPQPDDIKSLLQDEL